MKTVRRSKLSRKQLGVLDGLMLSDASLDRGITPRLSLGVKHKSFAIGARDNLPFDWAKPRHDAFFDKRTGKTYKKWTVRTHTDLFLKDQRSRWYPNGTKIVPKDILLSQECLIWWYLGDGHLAKKKTRPEYRRVVLCTDSFTKKDIGFLIDKLKKMFGKDSIYEEDKHVIIAKKALCSFVRKIGAKSPVSAYNYKFDFGQYLNDDYLAKSYAVRSSVVDFGDRMRQVNSKRIVCIETGKRYASATLAASASGYSLSSIAGSAKNGNACGKFHWKYERQGD